MLSEFGKICVLFIYPLMSVTERRSELSLNNLYRVCGNENSEGNNKEECCLQQGTEKQGMNTWSGSRLYKAKVRLGACTCRLRGHTKHVRQ
jgi:hypothetical protein